MKKEDAIKTIVSCANDYHTYLENHNLLFIFGTPKEPNYFEAAFLPRHFLHLTGVDITKNRVFGSVDFYNKALNSQLSPNDFSLATNGTTEMKLRILPQLMKIHCSAKMIGDYNSTKSVLYTEKLVGSVTACLGFVRDNKYFIPNTALNEDIRDFTHKPQQRILAVFRKSIEQDTFQELCYIAKGITTQNISFPKALQRKVVLQGEHRKKTDLMREQIEKPTVPTESTRLSMKERMAIAQAESDRRNSSHAPDQPQHDKTAEKGK